MNDRDVDVLVLKHFGLKEDDKFNVGRDAWMRDYNLAVRDNPILRAAAERYSGLNDNDTSATAVLVRYLFGIAADLADHLRTEALLRHQSGQSARRAEEAKVNAEAVLSGISALERQVAMAS